MTHWGPLGSQTPILLFTVSSSLRCGRRQLWATSANEEHGDQGADWRPRKCILRTIQNGRDHGASVTGTDAGAAAVTLLEGTSILLTVGRAGQAVVDTVGGGLAGWSAKMALETGSIKQEAGFHGGRVDGEGCRFGAVLQGRSRRIHRRLDKRSLPKQAILTFLGVGPLSETKTKNHHADDQEPSGARTACGTNPSDL